jgi:6-phosphofructokinase
MAHQRMAIKCGGYAPGLNDVVIGALAANEVGWEVVCAHDGDVNDLVPGDDPIQGSDRP